MFEKFGEWQMETAWSILGWFGYHRPEGLVSYADYHHAMWYYFTLPTIVFVVMLVPVMMLAVLVILRLIDWHIGMPGFWTLKNTLRRFRYKKATH